MACVLSGMVYLLFLLVLLVGYDGHLLYNFTEHKPTLNGLNGQHSTDSTLQKLHLFRIDGSNAEVEGRKLKKMIKQFTIFTLNIKTSKHLNSLPYLF